MARGQHAKPTKRMRPSIEIPRQRRGRKRTLIVAACLVAAMSCAGAFAWFHTESGLLNMFQQAKVTPGIDESFEQGSTVKENVTLKNDGNVNVYMRASVSVRWETGKREDGTALILDEVPVLDTDYTMDWGLDSIDSKWVRGVDGLYYWTEPVAAGASTKNLIDACTLSPAGSRSDRHLVVEIDAQSVQADPRDAVLEAWGAATGGAVTAVDEASKTLTINPGGGA